MTSACICLNMIVRNERHNLAKNLPSLLPIIDRYAITDTGSNDGTVEFIEAFFKEHGIPGSISHAPFQNFAQARNAALELALSDKEWNYLLLCDADMELEILDSAFKSTLQPLAYLVEQRSGIRYRNLRLLHRVQLGRYKGVTHEFLETNSFGVNFEGIRFIDHENGSNRPEKVERDIRLLKEGLSAEPENARYWFYLAQTYFDSGQYSDALLAYHNRLLLDGWIEENWYCWLRIARAHLAMGNHTLFIKAADKCLNLRPHRAEAYYELARYYRNQSEHQKVLALTKQALALELPKHDVLFIEDWVYRYGLKEEFSISAYYAGSEEDKDAARQYCDAIIWSTSCTIASKDQAFLNQQFYIKPAREHYPSACFIELDVNKAVGYHATNPSIIQFKDQLIVNVRTVNYTMDSAGRYLMNDDAIRTNNIIAILNSDLKATQQKPLKLPSHWPAALYTLVLGLEDVRLYEHQSTLWFSCSVRELNAPGVNQIMTAQLIEYPEYFSFNEWSVLVTEDPLRHEKNWMPVNQSEQIQFLYLHEPVTVRNLQAKICNTPSSIADLAALRGGSQIIAVRDSYLGIVHEVDTTPSPRIYRHRFVEYSSDLAPIATSEPFYFNHVGIEFAAGLCEHLNGSDLIVSFGSKDNTALLAIVSSEEIFASLRPIFKDVR